MKINDMARLAGITVRTLRYYDEIGLCRRLIRRLRVTASMTKAALNGSSRFCFSENLIFPCLKSKELLDSPDYNETGHEKTGSPALAEAGSFERFVHPFKAQNERRKRYELFGI